MFYFSNPLSKKELIKKEEKLEVPELTLNPNIADKDSSQLDWKTLHNIADSNQPKMEKAFINSTNKLKDSVTLVALSRAISNKNIGEAEALINWKLYDENLESLKPVYSNVIKDTGKSMIKHLPPNYRGFNFDIKNPNIIDYINNKSSTMIKYISDSTRKATNRIILDTYLSGYHPDKAAKEIKSVIGLNEKQAKAVDNYINNAIEQGFSEKVAFKQGEKYSEKLLKYRAETIARTEMMEAVNRGYFETVNQGINKLAIPPNKVRKKWITTPDDRTCKHCRPMHGQVRALDEYFTSSLEDVLLPPLHPRCRCIPNYFIID